MRRLRYLIAVFILGLLVIPASADEVEEAAQLPESVILIGDLIPSVVEEGGNVYYVFEQVATAAEIEPLAEIQDNYGVGTTNITLFGPLASKLPYGVHYVYWREGQYAYKLAYSDSLVLSGSRFSAESVTVVTYTTSTTSQRQATWVVSSETDFVLDSGSYLVWSDLGDYPQLVDKEGDHYAQLSCVMLASFALFYLFCRLVASCRRLDYRGP